MGSIHLAKGNKGEVNWPGVSTKQNVMPEREAQGTNVRDAWDAILGKTKTFSERHENRVEMFRRYADASQRLLEEQVLKGQLSLVIFPQPKGKKVLASELNQLGSIEQPGSRSTEQPGSTVVLGGGAKPRTPFLDAGGK